MFADTPPLKYLIEEYIISKNMSKLYDTDILVLDLTQLDAHRASLQNIDKILGLDNIGIAKDTLDQLIFIIIIEYLNDYKVTPATLDYLVEHLIDELTNYLNMYIVVSENGNLILSNYVYNIRNIYKSILNRYTDNCVPVSDIVSISSINIINRFYTIDTPTIYIGDGNIVMNVVVRVYTRRQHE